MMYQPMLYLHWKQVRFVMIPFVVAAFGLPMLPVQSMGGASAEDMYRMVNAQPELSVLLFPLLAVAVGVTLALSAWNWDHRHNHVYALSLPVERWEYVMLKMGAGVVLTLLPVLAFWVGAQISVASVDLPAGLRAYPNALAFRFLLAVLLSYAFFFALAAGTMKTALSVLTVAIAVVLAGGVLDVVVAGLFPQLDGFSVFTGTALWMLRLGGPMEVFTGNWVLIDV